MGLLTRFFGFNGRITRRTFWFGLAILVIFSPFAFTTILSSNPFSDVVQSIRQLGLKGLIWSLVLLFMLAGLLTKRLHDRNKTGFYAVLFYGPALLQAVQFYSGYQLEGGWFTFLQDWGWLIGLELGFVGLWFLVELGFYGAVEPNKYGPNPRDD